jgi:hypothetical protein
MVFHPEDIKGISVKWRVPVYSGIDGASHGVKIPT